MEWLLSVILLATLVALIQTSEAASKPRIAVIGGGVGGTTASLFLREELGDDVEITLYEDNRIGGRLDTVEMGGRVYEAGGSVIHPRNMYAANLTQFLGLTRATKFPSSLTFGLYDGNEIVFQTHRYRFFSSWINKFRLFFRYGLDLLTLDPWVDGVLKWYVKIYPAQLAKTTFSSVYDMYHTLSSLFDDLLGSTIGKYLTQLGFGERFKKEIARIAMRTNYGQDLEIHAFVGVISLAGAQDGLWSVKDGNYHIAEKALRHSRANWVKRRVTRVVEPVGENTTYRVTSTDSEGASNDEHYDAVILAVPCTVHGCGGIAFEVNGIEAKWTKFPHAYHRTVANFVRGKLDTKKFFGVDSLHFPDCLYSVSEEPLIFNSICRQVPVDFGHNPNDPRSVSELDVYKIFTRTPLTKHHIQRLFKSHSEFKIRDWLAYPDYDKIPTDVEESLPSFLLDSKGGLVSINAIEASASAIEQSIIGAKNAALLVTKHLKH